MEDNNQYYKLRKCQAKTIAILCLFFIISGSGQTQNKISYNIFNQQPLGQLQIQTPQPAQFQQIDINHFSPQPNQQSRLYSPNPILGGQNAIEEQNRKILQNAGMLPGPTTAGILPTCK